MVSATWNKRGEQPKWIRGHPSCNADKIGGDNGIGGIYLQIGGREVTRRPLWVGDINVGNGGLGFEDIGDDWAWAWVWSLTRDRRRGVNGSGGESRRITLDNISNISQD
jgi:hypothetical protein